MLEEQRATIERVGRIGGLRPMAAVCTSGEDVTELYTRVKVGTRVVVLPGRSPATEAAMLP